MLLKNDLTFGIIAVAALVTACHEKSKGNAQKASAIASWSVAHPSAPVLADVVWSGTQFVAVGAQGSVFTSADGSTWTSQNANVTADLGRISWSGSTFVAIAGDGTVITSTNGADWTTRDNPLSPNVSLRSVTWADAFHQFIIAGNGNTPALLTSEDGASWTVCLLPTLMPHAEIANVACSEHTCLAVAPSYGGPPFALASNDLVQWAVVALSGDVTRQLYVNAFYDVVWSGTQFAALGIIDVVPPPSYIATSVDGVAWSVNDMGASDPPFNLHLNTVRAWGNGLIALGDGLLLTSPDGTTWTNHGSTPSLNLVSIAGSEAAGPYAAVATDNGYTALLTTSDLSAGTITWTESFVGFNLAAVCWTGDTYVAVGSLGTVQTSTDGRTWTSPEWVTGFNLNGVAGNGKITVAVGAPPFSPPESPGPAIVASSDNLAWATQAASIPNGTELQDGGLHAVIWSGDLFVTVGDAIFTSPDGKVWTWRAPGTENRLYAVTSGKEKYVAVGEAGTILTSPDAKTWTGVASGLTQDLKGVAWSGATFVAVGVSGAVLTSTDASTWTKRNPGVTGDLAAVAWTGAEFVATGTNGTLLTSTDGASWVAAPAFTDTSITGIATAPSGEAVCVGNYGAIWVGTP